MRRREPTAPERLEAWLRLWVTTFGGLGLSLVLTTRMSVIAGQVTDSSGVALAVVLLVVVGFGEGAALGALQWTALSKAWTTEARPRWIAASSVGVGGAWLLALVVGALAPRLLDLGSAWVSILALAGGALVGASIGVVQWVWALRPWFEGGAEWVVSSALGWCLAVVPVFVAAPRLLAGVAGTAEVMTALVIGALCAAVGAAIIATALESLIRRPRADAPHPPPQAPPRRVRPR